MWNDVLKKMTRETPQLAVKRWGGQDAYLVSAGVNLVYRFEKNNHYYYLRISHSALRSEAEMLAAIHYQQHVFFAGVTVCQPLLSDHGQWIEAIQQDNEVFLAHVVSSVSGKAMRFDYADATLYETWGKTLGELHNAASTYDAKEHDYASWQKSLEELHGYAQHEASAVQQVLASVSDYFKQRRPTQANYGLTHGDHRKGNVLCDGKQLAIIDFDLPCFQWFSEDVFRPFFSTIMKDQTCWQDKFAPYIHGYLSVRPHDSLDLNSFSQHLQLKALEIYLWTKYNWSGESAPGGIDTKQWLASIYQKLMDSSWIEQLATFS